MPSPPPEVTDLLIAWSEGDEAALQQLIPLVYEELRRLAHAHMTRERAGHMLQTTALVHEAYQRLLDTPHVRWRDRTHFLAVSAQLMRRVLVDCSRSRDYLKRGGGVCHVAVDIASIASSSRSGDFSAIDEALTALGHLDPRKSRVVELRFFGGLTVKETSELMKVSPETVMRDWKFAKVWLLRELSRGQGHAT